MPLTLFDPRGIDPTNYKASYPELDRIKEYQELSYAHLIFVWWYANPTSPLVIRNIHTDVRVKVAIDRSGVDKKVSKSELSKYLSLNFPENVTDAINRSHKFIVGNRVLARETMMAIFDNYQTIKDITNFTETKTDKEGNVVSSEIDYAKYLTVSTKISEAMPDLIRKIEEGFGIVDEDGIIGADADSADDLLGVYLEQKRH
jgi:hypothetical protein